jgi:hypothetical protein
VPSFDMIFSSDGEVLIGNIVDAPGGECMTLTAPYEQTLGVAERLEVLDSCKINSDVTESA